MPSSNYTAWSVIAGEQPTTAKWNILGTNDASFNTGQGFNDAVLINRHIGTNFISGGVTSYTNAGTAGGTFSYINLGGLKLLWGTSASVATNTGNPAYGITLPTSFFTTIQSVQATSGPVSSDSRLEPSLQAISNSSISVFVNQLGGTTGSTYINLYVVGI